MSNANQRIVITGITRGLGRAMTDKFIELGHTVLGCGRSDQPLTEMRQRHGPPHDFAAVDVSDTRSVQAWGKRLIDAHGPPDLLIHNAGLVGERTPMWEVDPDAFARVMDVNVNGAARVIHAFVPAMVERMRGVLVIFSSGLGRHANPNAGPYCASKFAVEGLMHSLAQELPEGMAAVPLSPGMIHTRMLEQYMGSRANQAITPEQWVERAAPFILGLGPGDNGRSLSVPGGAND